jgi:hypothetical protein
LISSPDMRAICCEGSAANAMPCWRQTSEWRSIASGSSGEKPQNPDYLNKLSKYQIL